MVAKESRLANAIRTLPRRNASAADRHAIIAARIAEVHAGDTGGFSVDEVERSIREELDI